MAKTGKHKRRIPGMVLELDDDDKVRLTKLVGRYQKQVGPVLKATKVFVIRQLLRHAAATRKLAPVEIDEGQTPKAKDARRLKGMVLELEPDDAERLATLVGRYESAAGAEGYRSSKAFVIRQLLRYAAGLKELPPLRS